MYMGVRHYHDIDPEYAKQSLERNRRTLIPLLKQQPGFVRYYTFEGDDGTLISIGVYESKEEADRSNQIAAEWVKQNSTEFIRKPPTVTRGEVLIYKNRNS